MFLQEKLATLLPTKISRNSALWSILLATPLIPSRDLLEDSFGITKQMAAWLAVSGTLGIVLIGSWVCLVSVIRHCHEQERKITALEQELRVEKTLVDHKKFRDINQTQDFGQMLDRHYLVNDRF